MDTKGRGTTGDVGGDARTAVAPFRPIRWLADRAADADALPTSVRAILGYYAETGNFDYRALRIKGYVDETTEEILDDIYAGVETELAREFDRESVSFDYETKLTLPAELTLGHLYRRAIAAADGVNPVTRGAPPGLRAHLSSSDDAAHERRLERRLESERNRRAVTYVDRAELLTEFVVAALLDGDMRDALNDAEYEDFDVDFETDETGRRRVAEVAQRHLQTVTERRLEAAPERVREAHARAVEISEGHQEQDERFRDLFAAARTGCGVDDAEGVRQRIREEYKFRPFPDDDHPFAERELDLPYLKTQYDRVGVIYDGMLDSYRGAGFDIDGAFERSIVLAIVGAQVWLDDVDDYRDDVAEGQLTPVTAEYVLTDDETEARRNVVGIATTYLDLAKRYAAEANSPLTGIATEYILRSGDPSILPGGEGRGSGSARR